MGSPSRVVPFDDLLNWRALQYVALGWALHPLHPRSKEPILQGWQDRASSDAHVVKGWWSNRPTGNIGVHVGRSGVVVIDVDPRNGGRESLARLEAERGVLWDHDPAIARTGGGGMHFVFRAAPGARYPSKLAPGVDLLSGNRYFLVEPSVHPSGGRYAWERGFNPLNMPELPILPDCWAMPLGEETTPRLDAGEALANLPPEHLSDTPESRRRVRSALDCLSADVDYPEWRDIVFATLATGLPDAAEIAREWSKGSVRYDGRAFDALVASYREERRHGGDLIGPGTLFHRAKAAGWTDPAKAAKQATGKQFEVIPAHAFAHSAPVSWLVQDLIQRDGLGVVFGESGSGKSFFVLDISAAIARGTEWRDLGVKGGPVVYVAAEGVGGFRKRLQAIAQSQGVTLDALPLGVIADAPNFLTDDDKAIAEAVTAAGGAVLIVVDTLAAVTPGGNENAAEDMGEVLARCKRLQTETGAAVVLVHHSGKDASRGARGWSGLRAAVDVEIEVTRDGDSRAARVTKQKDGEDGAVYPFRLQVVDLGVDESGKPITSCAVEHVDEAPANDEQPRAPTGRNQRIVFEVVEQFGPCDVDVVLQQAVDRMVLDPEKKDKRRDRAREALEALIAGKFVIQDKSRVIRLYGSPAPEWDVDADDVGPVFEGGNLNLFQRHPKSPKSPKRGKRVSGHRPETAPEMSPVLGVPL